MHAQGGFEGVTLEKLGVICQQFLKDPELERPERGAKKMRIEVKQLFENRLDRLRTARFPGPFIGLRGLSGLDRRF